MNNLLPFEALEWLRDNGYAAASHEERMELIRQAKELFCGEES